MVIVIKNKSNYWNCFSYGCTKQFVLKMFILVFSWFSDKYKSIISIIKVVQINIVHYNTVFIFPRCIENNY